jgi:WD40 repeat protein
LSISFFFHIKIIYNGFLTAGIDEIRVVIVRLFLRFYISIVLLSLVIVACSPTSSSPTATPDGAIVGDLGSTGARTTAVPLNTYVQWQQAQEPLTSETIAKVQHIGMIQPPSPLSTTFFQTFSPDGSQLILLNDSYLLGYDLNTGDLQFSNTRQNMTFVYASSTYPEIYGLTSQGTVMILEAETGRLISEFNAHPNFADIADFAINKGTLAIGGTDGTVYIWDAHNAELMAQLNAHIGVIRHLRLSDDGTLLLTAGDDFKTLVWDLNTYQAIHTIESGNPITNIAISPDNQVIASSSKDTIMIWQLEEGEETATFRYTLDLENIGLGTVQFSPDSAYLITGGLESDMVIWSATTGDLQAVLPATYSVRTSSSFNANNDLLAISLITEQVTLFDLASITNQTIQSAKLNALDRILSVAFTPDSLRLLMFQTSGNIEVWGIP